MKEYVRYTVKQYYEKPVKRGFCFRLSLIFVSTHSITHTTRNAVIATTGVYPSA